MSITYQVLELKDRRQDGEGPDREGYRRTYVIPRELSTSDAGFVVGSDNPQIADSKIQSIVKGGTYRNGSGRILTVDSTALKPYEACP